MALAQNAPLNTVTTGRVKWFDATKGFGFVVDERGGPDVLLHANVLRSYGRSSIAEGARVIMRTQVTDRGLQAVEVMSIDTSTETPQPEERRAPGRRELDDVPLEAARIKWFDKGKGFGFANVFGRSEDVFVHVEVLRQSGFSELQPGEAVAIKVIEGPRGKMAAEVRVWDEA